MEYYLVLRGKILSHEITHWNLITKFNKNLKSMITMITTTQQSEKNRIMRGVKIYQRLAEESRDGVMSR